VKVKVETGKSYLVRFWWNKQIKILEVSSKKREKTM
jgi:hypothetical protein